MVSEDSECRATVEAPISTSSIHSGGYSDYPLKPSLLKVCSFRHLPDDAGKGEELLVLATQ